MNYFIDPEALIADEAAIIEDDAAVIAEVAALEADIAAEVAASEALLDIDDGIVVTTAGGVVTVVVVDIGGVSSFLVQAPKDTAAASETINRVVFMFLLDIGSNNFRNCGNPLP